jgi:hypothetical protein
MESPESRGPLRPVNANVRTPGPISLNSNPFETGSARDLHGPPMDTPTGRTRVYRTAHYQTEICEGVRFSWGPVKVRRVPLICPGLALGLPCREPKP